MEEKNIDKVLGVLENGTELNLGIFPDTNIVKYGYSNTENELSLFIQGMDKEIEKIKNYIEKNEIVNFNKWSKDGYFVSGEGNVILLETKDEKINGLKKIKEQQIKTEGNSNIDENEIMNLFLFKIIVKNTTIMKY